MIVVKIMGGLGNQMFQYALGRHLAIINKTDLKLDISFYKENNLRKLRLQNLKTVYSTVNISEIPHLKQNKPLNKIQKLFYSMTDNKLKIYDENIFTFKKEILKIKDNCYLFGYWQSEKYFLNIKEILKNDFLLKSSLNESITYFSSLIINSCSVSLHIRRGDYQGNKTHPIIQIEYYINAIDIIKQKTNEKIILFIFSDDIDWCKINLKLYDNHYFVCENKDYEDLYLISLCKHHIIANSTFSWWGAWLSNYANKEVIAPLKWFQDGISLSTKDLIPVNWIRI
jgi:hypothetical protein